MGAAPTQRCCALLGTRAALSDKALGTRRARDTDPSFQPANLFNVLVYPVSTWHVSFFLRSAILINTYLCSNFLFPKSIFHLHHIGDYFHVLVKNSGGQGISQWGDKDTGARQKLSLMPHSAVRLCDIGQITSLSGFLVCPSLNGDNRSHLVWLWGFAHCLAQKRLGSLSFLPHGQRPCPPCLFQFILCCICRMLNT